MKSKKVIPTFLFVISMLLVAVPFASAETGESIQGSASIKLLLPFTPDFPTVTADEKKKLAAAGWIETPEGYVRYYPLINAKVVVDSDHITYTDENGRFRINGIFGKVHEIEIKHNALTAKKKIESTSKASVYFTQTINFMSLMDPGPSQSSFTPFGDPEDPYKGGFNGETLIPHNGHNDATYANNSYVTCNRFNGYLGNQVYYAKVTEHVIDYTVNFAHSDCDLSIAYYGAPCLNSDNGDYADDPNSRYCKSFALSVIHSATCSQLLSHKPLYHKHTTRLS